MTTEDDDFFAELLELFNDEAMKQINSLYSCVGELTEMCCADERLAILQKMHREAHSLKGAAAEVDLNGIRVICQSMENLLHGMKAENLENLPKIRDTLKLAVKTVEAQLRDPENSEFSVLTTVEKLDSLATG